MRLTQLSFLASLLRLLLLFSFRRVHIGQHADGPNFTNIRVQNAVLYGVSQACSRPHEHITSKLV